MSTNSNATATASASKRTAPAASAAVGSGTVATTKKAKGKKAAQASVPQAPLFVVGVMPPVRPGTHRAYAQAVARKLSKGGKGFTLAAFKAALIAGEAASSIAAPRGGWKAHNMPTWMANVKQSWLVSVKA